jgi:hypothetical protein
LKKAQRCACQLQARTRAAEANAKRVCSTVGAGCGLRTSPGLPGAIHMDSSRNRSGATADSRSPSPGAPWLKTAKRPPPPPPPMPVATLPGRARQASADKAAPGPPPTPPRRQGDQSDGVGRALKLVEFALEFRARERPIMKTIISKQKRTGGGQDGV